MSEHSILTEPELREARVMLAIHGSTLAGKGYVGGLGRGETYDGNEYHPDYVIALRCIDRMIPKEPVIRSETAERPYPAPFCPECGHILMDEYNDNFNFCPDCGQRIKWD